MLAPVLIDSHAHLASTRFDADRSDVRRRAKTAGVAAVLVVGQDLADNLRVAEVVEEPCDDGAALLPCFGLHPDRFAEDREPPSREEMDQIARMVRRDAGRLAAIGEVGLDRHWVKSEPRRAAQASALEEMVALSNEVGLALNVHSRSAGHYTIDLLVASKARRVLMHAYDGKVVYAKRAADEGYSFSIPPSSIRSEQKRKLIEQLPLDLLLLESDSPVLGPERGVRNEPANIALVLDMIAEAHGVSPQRVAEVTTANACRLFPALTKALGPTSDSLGA